ncbi:helix-turn-helix domain-containing protein [Paenibacillus profundus]|uniref:Helix-turn-helix domain-containing protein n=1 Tax=Paenibacillus profundus TaxID=1173085 RepID=A0ABS8YLM7_9BACL|nr:MULTISPECIES: ArsR family transcriptional regulator [Paenibacillus]MCE5172122.1 helix-turn-helix domain-containing protein [Paenibacillus profundus]
MTYHVRIDCSSVYELIGSFMLFAHRKWIRNVENGTEWIRQIEQQLPSEWNTHTEKIRKYTLSDFDLLYAMALERKGHDDILDYISQLEHATVEDWTQLKQHYGLKSHSFNQERAQLIYVPALKFWYEQYISRSIAEWEPILQHDVEEKARLMSKISPSELIEVATNGVVIPDNGEVSEVILAPMWHYRPMNQTCTFQGKILILYAVDEPEPSDLLPPYSLRRMTRALADDHRLRLLRFVGQEPRTFADIQEHLSLTTGTVKHHLAVLRSAGYIRTYWNGKVERISLRQEGLADLSAFLEDYVQS